VYWPTSLESLASISVIWVHSKCRILDTRSSNVDQLSMLHNPAVIWSSFCSAKARHFNRTLLQTYRFKVYLTRIRQTLLQAASHTNIHRGAAICKVEDHENDLRSVSANAAIFYYYLWLTARVSKDAARSRFARFTTLPVWCDSKPPRPEVKSCGSRSGGV